MISVKIIPAAEASATEQELLVEITEGVCKPFCTLGDTMPTATATFTAGTPRVIDGNAVTTITAVLTIVTPSSKPCGCAMTQVITEKFDLAFTATTANTITLTQGTQSLTDPAQVKCCKAHAVRYTTTLVATIA